MRDRIFFPQDVLDVWTAEERIDIQGNTLVIKEYQRTFNLTPAVHFVLDVGDGKDLYNLVGRVKDKEQLAAMNAEHYMDSVILGDSAYQVRQGYLGLDLASVEVQGQETPSLTSSSIRSAVSKTADAKSDAEPDEKDLLARFLLEKL